MKLRAHDLTYGERLLIWRRRHDLTQRRAARKLGLSAHDYRQAELGLASAPRIAIGKLKPHEVCLLLRRRAGIKLRDLADSMGVSQWWLTKMEAGKAPIDRLVSHWAA